MNKISDYLEELGLSEFETRLYVTLLSSGPKTVQELANKIGVNRTTSYIYLNQLLEKGLIVRMVKGAHTLMMVSDVKENLDKLLSEKIKNIEKVKNEFPAIIEKIHAKTTNVKEVEDYEIKYYKGELGARKIYEDALKTNELRSYVNPTIVSKIMPKNPKMFIDKLTKNANAKVYEIFDGSESSSIAGKDFSEQLKNTSKYYYKVLPKNMTIFATDTLIYDNKVAIINIREQITGVILKNNDYYKDSKELFDFIWNMLPKFNAENT